ncbi:uncharacterized protein FOMMEDRAFT_140309 [Fomitiporia mediterranea MF3/22]|uniref:uncharacterized protein n=1 Tax=Fomitiporia mediterranea (strain MF3/22) TaxID=694068 RepID=UPI000440909F|nr:uncharacterized protein FOMMEDRAFT_140309 [Fomitiporia mediterranea MF3/22]EJD04311.1 hypothetical protein FOMMEDRAFT_140309 [Fomitiporia mediterranea MF3/22]
MENNDTQPSVASVVSSKPEGVASEAQPTGDSDKAADSASVQLREEAVSHADPGATKEDSAQANDLVEAQSGARDTSSAETKPAGPTPTGSTQSYVPPVKRFSAVNINKKFLQKNQSSTTASGGSSPSSTSSKQAGVIARPAPQSAHSHSRLVTAKLTASPHSTSPGQGWSRPNSVTPPAPSPANAAGPAKAGTLTAAAPVGGHGLPHIAPGGKIIQPQVLKQKLDGAARPAWRNVQPGTSSSGLQVQNEFPTAAEAAQSRLLKHAEAKAATEVSDAQKQALSETADAFRGVHLDPNAHHWDEMEEEDNDDFLGDVIEFADGRQYTIHVDGAEADQKAADDTPGNVGSEASVSKVDRFVDDFDRSWPKSRPESGSHKDESSRFGSAAHSETSSDFPGHSPVSTRDGSQSRVLFNDRLNRMEPISGGRHGPGPQIHTHGGQGFRDGPSGSGRFHGGRLEREAPPHTSFTGSRKPHEGSWNVPHGHELSQRDGRDMKSHSPTTYFHNEYHDRKGRSGWGQPPNGRQFPGRDPSASRSTTNGAPSVASSDDHSSRHAPSVRDQQRGRFPSPGHTRDLDRQAPPHLAYTHSALPPERPQDAADSDKLRQRRPSDALSQPSVGKGREPTQSQPAHSAQTQPEATSPKATAPGPGDDVEAVRRAYLAESAERAKKRRQQEEEERLKAQERARKKAAELEAKIAASKATEAPKDTQQSSTKPATDSTAAAPPAANKPTEAEVLHVIEEAIGSATTSDAASNRIGEGRAKEGATTSRSSFVKTFTHEDNNQSSVTRDGQASTQPRPPSAAVSDRAESWRSRAKPPTLPAQNSNKDISREPAESVLPAVRAFEFQADESMEVVDFSDMGRLTGERTSQKPVPEAQSVPSGRPVASDFFNAPRATYTEQDSWRRGGAVSHQTDPSATGNEQGRASYHESPAGPSEANAASIKGEDVANAHPNAQGHLRAPVSPTTSTIPQHMQGYPGHQSSPGAPRFLRSPNASYREAPLSALDDTMSRIKGALDVMHSVAEHGNKPDSKDASSSPSMHLAVPVSIPSKPSKWLPPALRPQGMAVNTRRAETFEPTHPEPPRSPVPPDSKFTIRLPSVCRRIEPLTKRQINNYQKYFGPVRWEILSFEPPVEGMTKRNLSVNDVLFKRPTGPFKLRKYRVVLPPSSMPSQSSAVKGSQRVVSDATPSTSASKDMVNGAFGKARGETSSWRSTSASARVESEVSYASSVLDVTSRSPPPELSVAPRMEFLPTVSGIANKPKPSQKSLDVVDVAFYRDVRQQVDSSVNVPKVTFTVGSELDGPIDKSPLRKSSVLSAEGTRSSPSALVESSTQEVKNASMPSPNLLSAPLIPSSNADSFSSSPAAITKTLNHTTVDEKAIEPQSDPFLQKPPATPPPQNTSSTWAKSPARVPDPEHLKAVWSQASNNDSVPTVNSLKSIADDLTAVPFTLQEVKSEGGTPPPPPGPVAPPTRMSASEVTRAFQTVPSAPSNGMPAASLRSNQMPSNLSSPIGPQRALKPPAIGLPPPPAMNPGAPRPPYMAYSTSMSNHSPSPPTLVYSHVMPSGMAGSPSTSPYGQPVWMPVVQQGTQIIRAQPSSPYSPSLMPYAVPNAQNGVYPSSSMSNPQGSPATYPSAPPSQMMVSPVMSHASTAPPQAMYSGSPMVMHVAPPGGAPQPRAYPPGAVGLGRGSMPVQVPNPMDPRSHPPHGTPAAPVSRYPVHNPAGYTPAPPQSYVRHW